MTKTGHFNNQIRQSKITGPNGSDYLSFELVVSKNKVILFDGGITQMLTAGDSVSLHTTDSISGNGNGVGLHFKCAGKETYASSRNIRTIRPM